MDMEMDMEGETDMEMVMELNMEGEMDMEMEMEGDMDLEMEMEMEVEMEMEMKVGMEEAREGRWKRSRCQLYNCLLGGAPTLTTSSSSQTCSLVARILHVQELLI